MRVPGFFAIRFAIAAKHGDVSHAPLECEHADMHARDAVCVHGVGSSSWLASAAMRNQ
jgi:hypothetical protein